MLKELLRKSGVFAWGALAIVLVLGAVFGVGRLRAKWQAQGVENFQWALVGTLQASKPEQLAIIKVGATQVACTLTDRLPKPAPTAQAPVEPTSVVQDVPSPVQP